MIKTAVNELSKEVRMQATELYPLSWFAISQYLYRPDRSLVVWLEC